MDGRTLRFQLEGGLADRGAVRLDALSTWVHTLLRVLASLERDLSGIGRPTVRYRLVEVHYGSPLDIAIEACATETTDAELPGSVVRSLRHGLVAIEGGQRPPFWSDATIEEAGNLAKAYDSGAVAIRLVTDGTPIQLSSSLREKAARMLGPVVRSRGTWRGRLEQVNIHSDPIMLRIYPLLGPPKLVCRVPRQLCPDLGTILGKRVEVQGIVKARSGQPFPFEIEVEAADAIVPLPPQLDLPTAEQIIGSMPGAQLARDAGEVGYQL